MADIANGDICVAVGYSGSFSQAANRAKEAKSGVTVDMRLPKEGAPMWFDMLAIPKGAKNSQDAYTFINYLLQPQVIAPISDFVGYPNPNKDATDQVEPLIRNDPNLYPTEATMTTLYTLKPLGRDAERARTRAWTKIKSVRSQVLRALGYRQWAHQESLPLPSDPYFYTLSESVLQTPHP